MGYEKWHGEEIKETLGGGAGYEHLNLSSALSSGTISTLWNGNRTERGCSQLPLDSFVSLDQTSHSVAQVSLGLTHSFCNPDWPELSVILLPQPSWNWDFIHHAQLQISMK